MDEQIRAVALAKGEKAAMAGAGGMWRNAIADVTLALLEMGEQVTRETLRQEIAAHIVSCDNKFTRARLVAALNVLNGKTPRY